MRATPLPSTSTVVTKPTALPTPTLKPAPSFVDGKSEIPTGQYLFVQFTVGYDGKSTSGFCPGGAMADYPSYYYEGGKLHGIPMLNGEMISSTKGFLGYGYGFTGAMGGGGSSNLYTIDKFPYESPSYKGIVLHRVNAQGAIITEIWGSMYLIEPGQQWVHVVEDDPTPDCHRVTTYWFTNFGLLDDSQLVP